MRIFKQGGLSIRVCLLVTFLLLMIAIEAVIIFKFIRQNELLKNSLISIVPGEKISYFELISSNGEEVNVSNLKRNQISALFIFEQPCSPCNQNIEFWQRLSRIFKDKIKIYGIIIDESIEALNFVEEKNLNFAVYIPKNKKKFIDVFRLKTAWAQTILYCDKADYIKLGNLQFEDFIWLSKKIKRTIEASQGR